jgi:hypothetical protein
LGTSRTRQIFLAEVREARAPRHDQQASLLITAISSLSDGTSASLGRSTWRRSIKKHGSTAQQRLQDSSASDEGDQRLRPLYTGIRTSSKPLFKVRHHFVSFRPQNHCITHLYFHCFPSAEPHALLASARRPPLSSDILLWLLNPTEEPDACRQHSLRVRSPFDGDSGNSSTKSLPARALPRSVRRCRRHGNTPSPTRTSSSLGRTVLSEWPP